MSAIRSSVGMELAYVASLAPSRKPAMQPATITCDNPRADGAPCGATALVNLVHYHYGAVERVNWIGDTKELREAHYEIDCPRCGQRTQVVKYK